MLSQLQIKNANTIEETISIMNLLEHEAVYNPFFRANILHQFGNKSFPETIKKVWEYVVKNFKYVDSEADEDIISPKYMLVIKAGDCDNFSLFIKSALKVLGIESNYMLCGKEENNFSHIVVVCNGIILDGTNDIYNYLASEYICRVII